MVLAHDSIEADDGESKVMLNISAYSSFSSIFGFIDLIKISAKSTCFYTQFLSFFEFGRMNKVAAAFRF